VASSALRAAQKDKNKQQEAGDYQGLEEDFSRSIYPTLLRMFQRAW